MSLNDKKILKFDVIEMPDKCYINLNKKGYSSIKADDYIINGCKPIQTYKENWFEIEEKIKTVQRKGQQKTINHRYELKSGYPISDLTPQTIEGEYLPDEYEEVRRLYEFKYDILPAELEDYEFEVNVLAQRGNDFKFPDISTLNVSYGLLEEIETHPDLLFEKPCSLGGYQLFKIVKAHLSKNVNNNYARVDGHYDWRIKVDKRIRLAKSYTTRHDINAGTRRKSKWIETLHTDKFVNVVLFEDTSSSKIYPPTIYGENVEDLQNKLTEYLDGLVKMCNEPYKECECCNGYGVLLDE